MTETVDGDAGPGARGVPSDDRLRWLLLVGTPALLGVLFLVHPDGSGGLDGLAPIRDLWLALHLVMLPLLGLLGVSLSLLLLDYSGPAATIGRIGVAVYVTFYVAFEAIAGIATGVATHEAHSLSPGRQGGVAAVIDALAAPSVALAIVGVLGALVAVVSIGARFRRTGAPLAPVLLLAGLPLGLLFHGGTPLDAVGTAAYIGGLVWLELPERGSDARRTTPDPDATPDTN